MTRISMTFAAASLTLSLAPAAHAYQTEIELDQIAQATEVLDFVFSGQEMAEEGTCSTQIGPELALALGLTTDEGAPNPAIAMSLACNAG